MNLNPILKLEVKLSILQCNPLCCLTLHSDILSAIERGKQSFAAESIRLARSPSCCKNHKTMQRPLLSKSWCITTLGLTHIVFMVMVMGTPVDKAPRPSKKVMLSESCHLILFVSSTNYFQIMRRQCCSCSRLHFQ